MGVEFDKDATDERRLVAGLFGSRLSPAESEQLPITPARRLEASLASYAAAPPSLPTDPSTAFVRSLMRFGARPPELKRVRHLSPDAWFNLRDEDLTPVAPAVAQGSATEADDQDSPAEKPSERFNQWNKYLSVPPELRSWLTSAMIYVENSLRFINELDTDSLETSVQSNLAGLCSVLENITDSLESPYLDNGTSSPLGPEGIQNVLLLNNVASIMQLRINMTEANELDPDGVLGTAFKYAVLDWFREDFGGTNVFFTPEETSFLIVNGDLGKLAGRISTFNRKVKNRLKANNRKNGWGIDPALLAKFEPKAMGMHMKIKKDGASEAMREANKSDDDDKRRELQEQVIELAAGKLKRLAVLSELAERSPREIGLKPNQLVYDTDQAKIGDGEVGYELFKEKFRIGAGYVPAAVYWPPHLADERPSASDVFNRYPRLSHDIGRLSFTRSTGEVGGLLPQLSKALQAVANSRTPMQKRRTLNQLKSAANDFEFALEVGARAQTYARNPAVIKGVQDITLYDGTHLTEYYAIEKMRLLPGEDVHLVTFDIDWFKSFMLAHGVDEDDSEFWGVTDPFFSVAKSMGMHMPVIARMCGDFMTVAVPTQNFSGNQVDIREYVRQVQETVREAYGTRPFQVYEKWHVDDGVERTPVWEHDGKIVVSKDRPSEDAVPLMRELSITAAATTIPKPATALDRTEFFNMISHMSGHVERLKNARLYEKGGFVYIDPSARQRSEPKPLELGSYYTLDEAGRASVNPLAHSFVPPVADQLADAWQEQWTEMPTSIKDGIMGQLYQHALNQTPILMPNQVQEATMHGYGTVAMMPSALPAPTSLVLPMVASGIAVF